MQRATRWAGVAAVILAWAATVTGASSPTSTEEVDILIRELRTGSNREQIGAARTLVALGPVAQAALPALVETLYDEDYAVGRESAKAIAAIGPTAELLESVVVAEFEDDDRRDRAWLLLRELNADHAHLVPTLLPMVDHQCEITSSLVGQALVRIAPTDERVLERLTRYVRESGRSSLWRYPVAEALAERPETASAVLPALLDVIRAQDEPKDRYDFPASMRRKLMDAAARLAGDDPAIIETLQYAAATDPDAETRVYAARTLLALNAAPEAAVREVIDVLGGADAYARSLAAELAAEHAELFIPVLIDAVETAEDAQLIAIAEVLGNIGEPARDAKGVLMARIRPAEPSIARQLIWTLGGLGESAVPSLMELLGEWHSPSEVGEALERVGPPALPAIEEAITSGHETWRTALRTAKGRIQMVEPARRSAWVTSNGLALRCIVSGLTIKPSEEWFVRGTIRNVTHRRIPLIQTPFGTLGRGHTEFTTGDGADVEQIMTGDVYPGRGWDAVLLRAGHEITMNHRFELSAPRGKVGFGIRRYADLLLEEFPRGWIVEPGPIEVRFSIQNEHMNIPASRHPPKEETPFMERFGIPGWRGRLTTPPIQVEIRDEPQE